MIKVRCFACHKFDYYVRQCPNKKGKGKTSIVTKTQMDELSKKFDKDFALASCFFGTIWKLHDTGKQVQVSETGTGTKREPPKFWKQETRYLYIY